MFEKISGKKIKEAIKKAGFTQVEFAKKLNCKQSYISQMINETTNVSEETLKKISVLTKQPLNYFVDTPQNSNILKLPILTTVMCGKPDYCELDEKVIDDFLEVPHFMFPNSDFIVKCLGTSMLPDIPPQAYCVIRKMDTPLNNKFMLVKTENGFTIKKIVITNGKIQLEYLNPKGKKIIPKELKIIGKVLGIFNKF